MSVEKAVNTIVNDYCSGMSDAGVFSTVHTVHKVVYLCAFSFSLLNLCHTVSHSALYAKNPVVTLQNKDLRKELCRTSLFVLLAFPPPQPAAPALS